jgi:lysozyme
MKHKFLLISIISTLVVAFSVGGVWAFNFSKRKTKQKCSQLVIPKDSVGIDVSHHQGDINWQEVSKQKILFVYIKATEGKTYTDPKFHANIKGAKKHGLKVGAYHFFRMTSGAREQFNHFYSQVGKYKMDLIPMIDVEVPHKEVKSIKQVQDSLDVFIKLVTQKYGKKPMIYGTQRSYNTYCASKYNNLHLYIGRYNTKGPEINGKGSYTIWQYSECGKIKGIPKPVDLCKFRKGYGVKDIKL